MPVFRKDHAQQHLLYKTWRKMTNRTKVVAL